MAKKPQDKQKERLFKEKLVPAKTGSGELFDVSFGDEDSGPVDCLGMTFDNDQARREYFMEKLREKLKDPVFRQIEGFPIGEDEDILALSDPPYYTACPNPFIEDFLKHYGKPYDSNVSYSKEPFTADVSEGKNDPIYNAHSYHTKVPHKAIMRYILHYTEPGDVVLDGFCGTGMTGVAAQLCGDRGAIESLGFDITDDAFIKDGETTVSRLGSRNTILNDLSPLASFVSHISNARLNADAFKREAACILVDTESECAWMYETRHPPTGERGVIVFTIWSDVFACPECADEIVFWDAAVDKQAGKVNDDFPCPHCNALVSKTPKKASAANKLERVWET